MAWKETTHHEVQTPWVKAEMRKKTLFFRWMDDVVHIIDKSISREGRKATSALKKKNFYGKGLDLLPEPGVRRAFGFHWGTAGGVVTCRGLNQFEREGAGRAARKEAPVLQGGNQYCSSQRRLGAGMGRLMRALDTTNGEEEDVKRQIARILFELKGAGYNSEEIEKLIRRTEKEAWFGLKELRPIAKMDPDWAKIMGAIDDLLRTVED